MGRTTNRIVAQVILRPPPSNKRAPTSKLTNAAILAGGSHRNKWLKLEQTWDEVPNTDQ
jgi:hypothetical protein